MPMVRGNGIELFYDEFGAPDAPPVLLIMGLATQMIAWPEDFCVALAGHGYRVIRFDNRDVGLSTWFDDHHVPGPAVLRVRQMFRRPIEVPYTLGDMAGDALGLLDALEIESAHVAGVSMGGMIAQRMAIQRPERLRSLVSIMSSTGHPRLPGPRSGVVRHMIFSRPKTADPEAIVQYTLGFFDRVGSPEFPTPHEERRRQVERALDRAFNPSAFRRHMAAILHDGDRSRELGTVRVPTLVIHGKADPLVPPVCGQHTRDSIPGARLELIEGMGHDLPAPLLPRLAELIAGHAGSVSAGRT